MEVFEKLLNQELYAYFKNASFYQNPVFHSKHGLVCFYVEFENYLPFSAYQQIITNLQLSLHAHVQLHIQAKNNAIQMDELDQYVNYFVEKNTELKAFRFLHPYMEKDVICFSTRDETRLASLKLALPKLLECLKDVGIQQEIIVKQVQDNEAIETAKVEVSKPAPVQVAEPEKPAPAPQNGGVTGLLSSYTEAENYETASAKAHESREEKHEETAPAVNARRVNVDSIPALRPLEPEYGVELTDADYLNEGRTEPLQKIDAAPSATAASAPATRATSTAPSHAAPAPAHKKRDIQLPSLTGALNSAKINENLEKESEKKRKSAVDRLGTELPSLTAVIDPVEQQKAVSNVGAFGVGEATGSFAPITDEDLIRANDGDDDIYVYDADDSELQVDATQSGAVAGPGYVDIPDTHAESIFGKLFSKKKKTEESSFSESIGVDENWEARKVGKDRGDWSSFQDDDDWNGGAVIVSSDEGQDEYAQQEASRDAIYQFTTNDINAEVWCVALGAELSNHSGLDSFMTNHADELKGATFIVMDGLGAGEIALVETDGIYKTHKVNARMKRCARNAAKLIGKSLGSADMNWTNSVASKLYDSGFKCLHVAGVENGKPAFMAEKADTYDAVEPDKLMESADFIMEIVRSL